MSTVEKGNKLEDKLYNYLCEQQSRGVFVYGALSPELCKIHKKKKYYCKTREAFVEFDVVIELSREGSDSPHLCVVFECKNYKSSIPERDVTDFLFKLSNIFPRSSKGVMVVSTRLQSGAETTARNHGLGIAKYDEYGLDVIAERKGGISAENGYVKSQIFSNERPVKSLKFSAYFGGKFFGAIDQFLANYDPRLSADDEHAISKVGKSVPFISHNKIQQSAQNILDQIGYESGPVDLEKICSILSIDLTFTKKAVHDADGKSILGAANFDHKSIQINSHANKHRERFTLGHEIGHFCLQHGRYLLSETIAERDLLIDREIDKNFKLERLEYQANVFASDLILPEEIFKIKINEYRKQLNIKDKGFGYIYVDEQVCNNKDYYDLLSLMSSEFEVSKQAIEIKLKKMGLLTDRRKMNVPIFQIDFGVLS